LTVTGFSKCRTLLVFIAIAISFLFFVHYDFIRDRLGHRYLDGYEVQYEYDEVDDFGRVYQSSHASAHGFLAKAAIYLSTWGMIGLCVGIPVATSFIANSSINLAKKRKGEIHGLMDSSSE